MDDITRIQLLDNLKNFLIGGYYNEIKLSIEEYFNNLYNSYVVDTLDGCFRVFRTMTYGEMLIASLLVFIIMILILKWIWEVVK